MFAVYKAVLIDRLPVAAEERLVVMNTIGGKSTNLDLPISYLATIARDSAVFESVAGVYHRTAQLIPFRSGSDVVTLAISSTSDNYFDVLGMRPAVGRLFRAEDARKGAPPVVVLNHAAWRRDFGGDSSVIGRTITPVHTGQPARIVGVAPAGFDYPAGTDVWAAMPDDPSQGYIQVDVIARLAPTATIGVARDALFALTRRVVPFPDLPGGASLISSVAARSLTATVFGELRAALVMLMLAVGLLLLIACVNVGNLVLVHLIGRTREIAVRRAIGASYIDVVRLFTIESAMLACVGGAAGSFIAFALIRAMAVFAPAQLPRRDLLTTLGPPVGAVAAISVVAFLIFGLAPSLVAPRVDLFASLRADARAGADGKVKRRARRWLVATQTAVALVLLAGAGLLARTLAKLESIDLGYRAQHLSMLSFADPVMVAGKVERVIEAGRALVTRLEATPGVEAAAPIANLPFKGQSLHLVKLAPAEQPAAERERYPFIPFEFGSTEYFRVFSIPIRRGRGFLASDTKSSPNVVVVSETLARQLWPNEDALGKTLAIALDNETWTVVGVAADTRFRELRRSGPVAYFHWEQFTPYWTGLVAVRTAGTLSSMLPALRAATREANPTMTLTMTLWKSESMDDLLGGPLAQPRMTALLLAIFSSAAVMLSAIGLYGVMSSAVREQTRDIGVRLALGASPRDVRGWILGDAMRIVGVGAATGIVGALATTRVLTSQLFDVSPLDPVSLSAAAVLLILIGAAAAYLPARRAARIDPVDALRSE
jgi:putative ABC transport system permease protein